MNILLWIEEEQLRDVVIFDPIAYFVAPATVIISKLVPTIDDSTTHETEIHKRARREMREEYQSLVTSGVLEDGLIPLLLRQYTDRVSVIVRLMVKFCLLVPIIKMKDDDGKIGSNSMTIPRLIDGVDRYIVPALLPDADASSPLLGKSRLYLLKNCIMHAILENISDDPQ
jgi:hypothetical protein